MHKNLWIALVILAGHFSLSGPVNQCLANDKLVANASKEFRKSAAQDGPALQNELHAIAKTGGTLRLPKSAQITCTKLTETISGEESAHALLVPQGVTLDLNGGTLLLALNDNCYGVRLMSDSAIRNGTIRIISSENKGEQRCWHSAVSVGAAYGFGGTVEKPSIFSYVSNWAIENLTIDQPYETSCIAIISEAHHGVIRNINILDSDKAVLGVGLDWGSLGPITTADEAYPRLRGLWENKEILSLHPHDILIENITVGHLNRMKGDGNDSAVRCSACHNITIRNVKVKTAGSAISIWGGDSGYEHAPEEYRHLGHTGYVIENVKIDHAKFYGVVFNGDADNVTRSIRNHGYDALLDTVHPGISGAVMKNLDLQGVNTPGSRGIYLTACSDLTIDNAKVAGFETGLAVNDWVQRIKVTNAQLKDNKVEATVAGATEPPVDIEINP